MHVAIPLLCEFLLNVTRFLYILEPSRAILDRAPTAAMFTSTVVSHSAAGLLVIVVCSRTSGLYYAFKGAILKRGSFQLNEMLKVNILNIYTCLEILL